MGLIGKRTKRVVATALASTTLLGLVGCTTGGEDIKKDESITPDENYSQILDEQQAQIDELKDIIDQIREELDASKSQIEELADDYKELNKVLLTYVVSIQDKLPDLAERIEALEDADKDQSEQIGTINADIADINDQITSLSELMEDMSDAHSVDKAELVAKISALKSVVDKLTISMSIVNTFATRYNSINIHQNGNNISIYTHQNGSYIERTPDYTSYYDMDAGVWYRSGSDKIYSSPSNIQTYFSSRLTAFDTVEQEAGSTYVLSSTTTDSSATVSIDSEGMLSHISYSGDFGYGEGDNVSIDLREISKTTYDDELEYTTNDIHTISIYGNYLSAVDATCDANYIQVNMSSGTDDQISGQLVVSKTSGASADSDYKNINILENGEVHGLSVEEDGSISTHTQTVGYNLIESMVYSLKKGFISAYSNVELSFNQESNSFIMTAIESNHEYTFKFELNEAGKIARFIQTYMNNGHTNVVTNEFNKIDKSTFNMICDEIKGKFDELIAGVETTPNV